MRVPNFKKLALSLTTFFFFLNNKAQALYPVPSKKHRRPAAADLLLRPPKATRNLRSWESEGINPREAFCPPYLEGRVASEPSWARDCSVTVDRRRFNLRTGPAWPCSQRGDHHCDHWVLRCELRGPLGRRSRGQVFGGESVCVYIYIYIYIIPGAVCSLRVLIFCTSSLLCSFRFSFVRK